MAAKQSRSPAARASCRCWRSGSPRRRLSSTCASLPSCGRSMISEQGVTLGAMVRWRDILDDARLRAAHPLLVDAIEHVAHYQIRNRGTVGGSHRACRSRGGNAGHRRDLRGARSSSSAKPGRAPIAAANFFQGPLMTALKPDEIITEIRLPPWPRAAAVSAFAEFARRQGDFAMAGARCFMIRTTAARSQRAHIGAIRRCRPAAAPCRRRSRSLNGKRDRRRQRSQR